jgi:hypothetical protein
VSLSTSSRRSSIYRVPGETEPLPPRVSALPEGAGILVWSLACALLRVGFFVVRGEHFGVDPAVAFVALGVTLHSLYSLARLPRI